MPTQAELNVDFTKFHIKIDKMNEVIRRRIASGLLKGAEIVRKNAQEVAPRHVGEFIQISPVTSTGANELTVRVFVKLSDAPDARAWEYGSGLHATRGPVGKYPIDAKNVPDLVFFWANRNKWFVGPHVNHPGIVGRPYLHIGLFDHIDEIKTALREELAGLGDVL